MTIRVALVAIAAAAAAALGAVSIPAAGGSSGDPLGPWASGAPWPPEPEAAPLSGGGREFMFFEEEVDSTFVDVGEAGVSPGDYTVFHSELHAWPPIDPSQEGDLHAVCTVGFRRATCHGTLDLFDRGVGKITFEGDVPKSDRFLLALTGGTRDFRAARGEMRVETDINRVTVRLLAR
jgi:hypothetical protein